MQSVFLDSVRDKKNWEIELEKGGTIESVIRTWITAILFNKKGAKRTKLLLPKKIADAFKVEQDVVFEGGKLLTMSGEILWSRS
jgi:hypothetical protein